MKTIKRTVLAIVILFSIAFANGCYYLSHGQFKSMEKLEKGEKLNLYECCCSYTINTAGWMFGWVLSPEAAGQCFLMQFGRDGWTYHKTSDFLESEYIRTLWYNNRQQSFLIDYPLNEITENKDSKLRNELRYALAFDGGTASGALALFSGESAESYEEIIITVLCKYDKYTAVYNIGPLSITFNWQLLNHIQERGWLHKCSIEYRTTHGAPF